MGFVDCHSVESTGESGGLALIWRKGVELEVIFADRNVIAPLVYSSPPPLPPSPWLLFAVYGPSSVNGRAKFWGLMEGMVNSFAGPWLAIGDFNCLINSAEKRVGRQVGEGSTRSFKNFGLGTEAINLGFCGSKFTWSNKRAGFANVKERLDRGVCNQEWQGLFPKAEIKPLIVSSSDHNPILLDTHLEDNSRGRPFRFEAMWTGCNKFTGSSATSASLATASRRVSWFQTGKKDSTSKRQAKRVEQNTVWICKNQNQRVGEEKKIEEIQNRAPTRESRG